jgi:hypothetical protein
MLKSKQQQEKGENLHKNKDLPFKLPGKEHHFAKGSCGQLPGAFLPGFAVPLRWWPLLCISSN